MADREALERELEELRERLSREEIDALYDVLKGLEEKEHG